MAINLNREPYFDDYDEDKGFYKILFRPGYAVQTRELNQIQTLLQKQIERFGEHTFREGSIVLGGAFDLETNIQYVKIQNISPSSDVVSSFVGNEVVGTSSGIRAYVRAVDFDETNNHHVLFVRYSSAADTTDTFIDGETLDLDDGDTGTSITADVLPAGNDSTGVGSIFTVEEGVLFTKGYFVAFDTQRVVLERYSSSPTATLGFNVSESIVTPNDDSTLLDNAQGTFNFAAPGAHRLFIGATLQKVSLGDKENNPDFINILNIQNGIILSSEERSSYSRIYEEIAKRTFDESGDYYVRGFGVRSREYLDTGTNEGYLTASAIPATASQDIKDNPENYLSIDVEPGLAYVKGYEINQLVTRHVPTQKSLDFEFINNQILSARTGGYILVDEAVGTPVLDDAVEVTLYDTAENRVTNQTRNTVSPTGSSIGTAKIKSIVYEEGDLGTASARFRLYLFDIDVDGDLSSVRSVYFSGTGGTPFFADTVLNSNSETVLLGNTDNDLIFNLGTKHTRAIRDESGTTDTSFIFHRTANTSINLDAGNGELTISVGTTNESLPYSDGVLSNSEKEDFILTVTADQDLPLPGTVSTTSGSATLTGSSTFFTRLNVGDRIKITDGVNTEIKLIESIASDTQLTVDSNFSNSFSGDDLIRSFFAGDIIDLTVNGSSGANRSITISSNGSVATIDIGEDVSDGSVTGTISAVLNYHVQRSTAAEITKALRPSRFVKIDCSALGSLTDPIDLGFSDVWEIRQIRKDTSAFTSDSQGSDVTNEFIFDNGQRDNFYDHATIRPIVALTSSDYLLVELDYFEPLFSGSFGYFSVDSYPIDDTQDTNTTIFTYEIPKYENTAGTIYDLRDVLDFRPVIQNTANDATTVSAATSNPASSSSFNSDSNGLRIAVPSSRINLDYSYFIARRDVVTLDKEGIFSVVRGEPAEYPVTPAVSDNVMAIANVYIPPFPSISETLGRILNQRDIAVTTKKVANIRHTQRDIGVLKQRIENLEYYNALSLLEKDASDLTILDDTGLDRFKNGIFVDGFMDHSLGATSNPDYNVSVDKIEKTMRPTFDMDSYEYQFNSTLSSGVQKTGNLITLPYTETAMIEQLNVTTTRNIEQSVFRYIGTLELTPDNDVWVDTNTVDKTIEFGNDLPEAGRSFMDTEWGSWETYATGYNVYRQSGGWTGLRFVDGEVRSDADHLGVYNSYADALNAARRQASYRRYQGAYVNGVVEPVDQQLRTGIQTTVTYEKDIQELGSFVTDVSIVPYIRPQEITLYAQGLKNLTQYYVFFDGEDMTEYVTPYTIPADGNLDNATLGNEGDQIRSDEFGDVYAILRLPVDGKRFRVGNKEIVITDSPTNDPDSTSYATEYFYAQGLDVQKQNTVLSTRTATVDTDTVTETRARVAQNVQRVGPSCMAYSFLVDAPPEQEGVFLTSVDVFIESMHPTLGVWFEIREMDSGGNITRTQVPYSQVWMKRDDPRINFWDGTGTPVATNVNFESPVFLYNDTQYAFVIHTEGLNPDTYFWVSRLGEEDIITGDPVTSRQLTGTLFTTNNNLNYDIVPDLDMMVRFNRASFNVGSGQAILGNKPYEFLNVGVPSSPFTLIGEEIQGSDRLTLANLSGSDTIVVGDTIIGSTSNATGVVTSISGSRFETDGFDFEQGEQFTVEDSGGSAKDRTGTISAIESGVAYLKSYDSNENRLELSDSNGQFFASATLRGVQSNNTVTVTSFTDQRFSVSNLKPDFLSFNDTTCTFEKRGYDPTSASYAEWVRGNPNASSSFGKELAILSRTNEPTALGTSTNESTQVRVSMETETEFLSPIVDMSRAHSVFVHNLINTDTADETESSDGNLINKYISKIITLDEGQDAEDLIVYLSMYRPPIGSSDVRVWARFRHREDSERIDEKQWFELTNLNADFSSLGNQNNFIEGEFVIPSSNQNGSGIIIYDKDGTTFTGFKQFQLKVGLLGNDSSVVPRVGDLRAIALQV